MADWENVISGIGGALVGISPTILAIRAMLSNNRQLKDQLEASQMEVTVYRNALDHARDRYDTQAREMSELRSTCSRYEASIERLGGSRVRAVVGADEKGCISSWGAKAEEFFGYSSAETLGQPLTMLMQGQDRSKHLKGFGEVATGARSIDPTIPHPSSARRKDGSVVKIISHYSTWPDKDGRMQFEAVIELA